MLVQEPPKRTYINNSDFMQLKLENILINMFMKIDYIGGTVITMNAGVDIYRELRKN